VYKQQVHFFGVNTDNILLEVSIPIDDSVKIIVCSK
jgi:hypothetical protein